MKKRTLAAYSLLAAASLAMSATAQTAGPVESRAGIDLSYELAIPSGSRGAWDTGSGVTLAGLYKWYFAPRWTFTPALAAYYNTMGADYMVADNTVYDSTIKNFGLRLPLMIGFDVVQNDNLIFTVATGPWVNFNLYARQNAMPDALAEVPVPPSVNLFNHGFKRVEGLWGIALNATFSDHYTVGITSSVAFTPLANYGNHDNKLRIRRNTIAISLGYKF
ncbi:MAG: outer membrane beta-barrel protein [Bacteroidales bacterium]|nr:outer membrane beta-barrel protein [Bacteroidales bacterium]